MYNSKSAKDLLSQFPKRMAEGGEATKEPAAEPAAAAVGSTPTEWMAPAVAPNFVGDVVGPGTFAPVAARRTQLTPLEQLPVTPSTLSASQQFARDRAAQQALLKNVLSQSGAPLSALEQRALQQKIYAGNINAANINEQVLYPLYEQRLQNAYKAVGLGGGPSGSVNESRQAEYDAYLKQLKEGKISGADFENKFLTDIANYSGADKFDTQQFNAINKAREALKMPLLEKPRDPYANSGFMYYGSPNFMGIWNYGGGIGTNLANQNRGVLGLNSILSANKPAPAPEIKPVDFGAPTSTQLFAEGGEVNKVEEKEQGQDFSSMTEEDRKRLALILEQRALQGARMDFGPVSASLVPSSKAQGQYDAEVAANLFGVQPFVDLDLKTKKINQMGARYGGQSPIGNYEIQYALDPETKQPVVTGALRKQLSPSSAISAEGVYVPVKDAKDYYNVGVNYVKEFEKGGEVTPNKYVDKVASWGRKGQEAMAGLVGLGEEVEFANEIPTRYFSKEEQLDGRGDAMRHLLLQAQIQKKYGDKAAKIASWIHENMLTGGQSDEEKAMDEANDALGRDIGSRSTDKADIAWKALQAIESGKAKTIPKVRK